MSAPAPYWSHPATLPWPMQPSFPSGPYPTTNLPYPYPTTSISSFPPPTSYTLPSDKALPIPSFTYPAVAGVVPMYAPAKPKLTYFNGRGRAEIIRLLFAMAGVDYEDVRFKPNADNDTNPARANDELMEFKKTGNSVTGQVPYLEIDGMKLVQSLAIARYLARRYGYYGYGDPQQLQIDMVIDTVEDLRVKAYQAMFEKDEARKPAVIKDFTDTLIPKYAEALEKFLDLNQYKSGFFIGFNVTLADLVTFDAWSSLIKAYPDATKPYAKLAALVEKVGAIPQIATWVGKRPDTPF